MPVVRLVCVWLGGEVMITLDRLVLILACMSCLLAVTSLVLLLKVQELHERCMTILEFAYKWLEQQKQEAEKREGTD